MTPKSTPAEFEHTLATRLLAMADQATGQGVPVDLIVRALLAAGLSLAQRHDSGASIAQQLQPVLDHLTDDDAVPQRPRIN